MTACACLWFFARMKEIQNWWRCSNVKGWCHSGEVSRFRKPAIDNHGQLAIYFIYWHFQNPPQKVPKYHSWSSPLCPPERLSLPENGRSKLYCRKSIKRTCLARWFVILYHWAPRLLCHSKTTVARTDELLAGPIHKEFFKKALMSWSVLFFRPVVLPVRDLRSHRTIC